jgi:hypothetical protein
MSVFDGPLQIKPMLLLFNLHFLLDQKVPKNQESPNVAASQSLAATRPFNFFWRGLALF